MARRDDDLIGGDETVEHVTLRTADVHTVLGGVSVPWLMKAFRMGRGTVEKKLRGCQPIGHGKHNTPLYDLPEAASYLVKPRINMEEYIRSIKPDQLPERLRESYWSAKLKEQRWREKAGDLWRTSDVLTVFGDVLQKMRTRLQLLPDAIEREAGLDEKQFAAARTAVDAIQDEIYQELQALAKTGKTLSQLGEEDGDDTQDDEDDLI